MARPDKAAAVAQMTDQFRSSNAAVLTEYRGLTVQQLQDLRRALGDDVTYAVVKNTLTKIAAKQAGVESFDALLQGPSAIAFIQGDPVEAAKALRDFARANAPLVIKGGVLDGNPITPAEIAKIADLESREVLLGQLAGALLASLQNAAYLFNAPLSQAARLAGALQAKAEQDPSILAGGAGAAPSDEAEAAEAPVTATEAEPTEAEPTEAEPTEAEPTEAEPVAAADAAVPPAGVVEDTSTDSGTSTETTESTDSNESTTEG